MTGPGVYNVPDTLSKNGCKFPQDKRVKEFKQNVPSPGTYEVNTFTQEKKMAKTIAGRFKKDQLLEGNKDIPGPGSYDPSVSLVKEKPTNIFFG